MQKAEVWYSDYTEYFYRLDTEKHKSYFRKVLKSGWELVTLPETREAGKGGDSRIYQIPTDIFVKVQKYARERDLTDTMVFLGAYGILLSKYTGKKKLLSSIILQNRIHRDVRDMVGMFVNTLPICLVLEDSIEAYMQMVKKDMLGLFRYQEFPLEDISEAVGMDRSAIRTAFIYQGDGERVLSLEGHEMKPQFLNTGTAKFDLSMELTPTGEGCRLRLEYSLERYDGQLMDRLADAYVRILGQLEKERLADISPLSEDGYHMVVETFNDTFVEYPDKREIHELFMEQANNTPEKAALIFEDKSFTYRQLNEMSNSLAHLLREKGLQSGSIVPIIAKRSWHVVVAMLGVLKAGGAYMLIDYQYPAERVVFLVEECQADTVLVYGYEYQNAVDLGKIDYDYNRNPLNSMNGIEGLFCLIHTSGSTGVPKAATLTHENIAHYIGYSEKLFYGVRQTIATTAITFDAFIQETLVSLCRQVPVILLNEMQIANQNMFENIVNQYRDSFLFQTPTKLQGYIKNSKAKAFLRHIKSFVVGGEVFPQELLDEIRNHNPQSRIYNIYGPTETTICAVVNQLKENCDITIGRPIDNTQVYILDESLCPVPVGVPGELCIAGEGVGKGYYNRPELTEKHFVLNKFVTKGNRHGRIMYRTGDLARWRRNGEIEYLGRIDAQVKIRGLRIELGEIENVMGSIEGIGLVAAAAKRDRDNRQYLVGYYTADKPMDESRLRRCLAAKLPKYMIPNYFMYLDSMPMTASNKIDRRNLPVPNFAQYQKEYVAPATETEKKLCRLMAELLHIEYVGVTDDFFELGGDSLTAMGLLARAYDSGISFTLQDIFNYPTVRLLCGHIAMGNTSQVWYDEAFFDKYRPLLAKNTIDESFVPQKKSLGNVLLTGATGFLGAHVLDQFMQSETGKIYCLVRNGEKAGCGERLRNILNYYFGDRYEGMLALDAQRERNKRIIPVAGDIESKNLAEYMPKDVQTVIHTAASVKHYGSYKYFSCVNVKGTKHVIEYARSVGAKLIHISTLSVSGNSMADDFSAYRSEEEKFFDETSYYISQPLDNVYIHSKFEAEREVFEAMLEGMDAQIIRVGNLTSRASDYVFQPNYQQNAFLERVKAVLELGMVPDYLMHLYAEFSPIDLAAEAVIKISQYADRQSVFHLNSNKPLFFDRFYKIIHELGISMKVADSTAFYQALRKTLQNRATEYIFEALQNDMDDQGKLVYDSNIHIKNDFTVWFLKKVGFEWCKIDTEYIKGYIEYFRRIGYLDI